MYSQFIKYDKSNGKITERGRCPTDMLSIQGSDTVGVLEVTEDIQPYMEILVNYYISNGVLTQCPISPITQSGKSFANIPTNVPVTLVLENTRYEVTASTVDLDINLPGSYQVTFEHFPYLDAIFTVTV